MTAAAWSSAVGLGRKEQSHSDTGHNNSKSLLLQGFLSPCGSKSHLREEGALRVPRGRELGNVHPGLWFIHPGLRTSESLGGKYLYF